MNAISKIIAIAKEEIGYLEKKNNSQLTNKTANAGYNNYVKYWSDVYSAYQGQPWCAAFVTWVFNKAFGKTNTKKLLKHYPYTYCPTIAGLFPLNANPKVGDIVIFKRNGEFVHTGIVTLVSGDYFETVEGNTSGGSTIIDNGGGVCKKSYYNSKLPGTKFITPDWSIVESANIPVKEYTEANDIIWELNHRGIISNSDLWVRKAKEDSNVYWFCRKLCHYVRTKTTSETATSMYDDIHDIAWDLNFRGIISDIALWEDYMDNDKNVYWLLQKGLHYCRTH